jgi:hypothetical protein
LESLENRIVPTTPAVLSIARSTPPGQYTQATNVTYAVTFNEPVHSVAATDFHMTTDGSLLATSPVSVAGSGSAYTVTITGIHGSGDLRLDLIGSGTIKDGSGNTLDSQGSLQGETYTIDQDDPHAVSMTRTNPAGLTTGPGTVTYTVTFSKPVTGVGVGDFQLVQSGNVTATVSQVTPVNGSVYTVTVSNISGLGTLGLNLVDNGQIHDLAGNPLAAANGGPPFAAPTSYPPIPFRPSSMTVADLRGDGLRGLVLTDKASNTVSVLLDNGNGSFQTPVPYAVGMGPDAVAVNDVNGDGIPDLIVANAQDNTVSVLLGTGNGAFQAQLTFAAGKDPVAVAAVDLNGDGKPDLVVGSEQDGTVGVLLGNGDGTFKSEVIYAVLNGPVSLAVADLNGDGIPDLVTTGGAVSVLLGNGDGTFKTPATYEVGSDTASVAVADLTGNGIPDLVVTKPFTQSGQEVDVLLGNGNGTFQNPLTTAVQAGPFPVVNLSSLAVADVTGDGIPDLLLANPGGPGHEGIGVIDASLLFLQGNGDGTFRGAVEDYSVIPQLVTTADVNGDGNPDILFTDSSQVAGPGSNTITVLLGTRSGSFTGPAPYTVGPASLVGRYVAQLYEDLLKRPVDPAGLVAWSDALDSASLTPQQVAASLVNSTEFRTLEVQTAYQNILDRQPGSDEVAFGVGFLNSGHTLLQLQAVLFASDEFFNRFGEMSNDTYVRVLHGLILRRSLGSVAADPSIASWVADLNNGVSRQAVAAALLTSSEADSLAVGDLYAVSLRRSPDPAGLQANINALLQGSSYEQLLVNFVASPEYQQLVGGDLNQHYVAKLYADLFGRPADSGGLASFTGLLDSGAAKRQQMVQALLTSAEYRTDVVNNLYQKYLKRAADTAGFQNAFGALSQGATDEQVAAQLVASAEFFNNNGGTADGFVQALYQDVLARKPSATEEAGWVNRLQSGASLLSVTQAFLGSDEYHRLVVESYYQQFLRRPADSTGLNSLASQLDTGLSDESVLALLVTSAEYYA